MKSEQKFLIKKNEVAELLKGRLTEVVITLGAGDIDGIAGEIINALKSWHHTSQWNRL